VESVPIPTTLPFIHQRAQTFGFISYKKKKSKFEKNVCIPGTTLCIQHNKNYKIDGQCKANEKSVSDQTSPNLGFFGRIR
jgi:hypothetical protein